MGGVVLPRSSTRPGGGTVPRGTVPVPAESKWTIDSVGGGHRRAATAGGAGEAEPVLLRLFLILIYRKKSVLTLRRGNMRVKLSWKGLQRPPGTRVFSSC